MYYRLAVYYINCCTRSSLAKQAVCTLMQRRPAEPTYNRLLVQAPVYRKGYPLTHDLLVPFLAKGVGFEPTERLRARLHSRQMP